MRTTFLFLTFLGAFSCTPDSAYYYCRRPGWTSFGLDHQIVVVSGKAPVRVMSNPLSTYEIYRSYDEGDQIVSVYTNTIDGDLFKYIIYKLDFSSNPPRFWEGYGGRFTRQRFEKYYKMPFQKKHIINPALLKYLPPVEEEGLLSRAWFDKQWIRNCEPMGVLEYWMRYYMHFFGQFMTV